MSIFIVIIIKYFFNISSDAEWNINNASILKQKDKGLSVSCKFSTKDIFYQHLALCRCQWQILPKRLDTHHAWEQLFVQNIPLLLHLNTSGSSNSLWLFHFPPSFRDLWPPLSPSYILLCFHSLYSSDSYAVPPLNFPLLSTYPLPQTLISD